MVILVFIALELEIDRESASAIMDLASWAQVVAVVTVMNAHPKASNLLTFKPLFVGAISLSIQKKYATICCITSV
jgi:hypothetical protein